MQGNLPPEAQEKLEELQQLQGTAQQLAVQKSQAETSLAETNAALDHLEEIDEDTEMYQEVGELLVATTHGEANEDLADRQETLERRVEALERQEERIQQQFEELQGDLQQLLGGQVGDLAG